jgi:hypothetical protein
VSPVPCPDLCLIYTLLLLLLLLDVDPLLLVLLPFLSPGEELHEGP